MPEGVTAYPLAWPTGVPRTAASKRIAGKFNQKETRYNDIGGSWQVKKDLTVAQARERLQDELARLRATLPILSSNLELRLDGMPRSGQREPSDPGVALYFRLKGRSVALPCDRYTTVADNIAAIAAHIAATRAIERHGVASIEQMFRGFEALPAPGSATWRTILGIKGAEPVTADLINRRRRELAARHHPDTGGDAARMSEINAAADAALREISDA